MAPPRTFSATPCIIETIDPPIILIVHCNPAWNRTRRGDPCGTKRSGTFQTPRDLLKIVKWSLKLKMKPRQNSRRNDRNDLREGLGTPIFAAFRDPRVFFKKFLEKSIARLCQTLVIICLNVASIYPMGGRLSNLE